MLRAYLRRLVAPFNNTVYFAFSVRKIPEARIIRAPGLNYSMSRSMLYNLDLYFAIAYTFLKDNLPNNDRKYLSNPTKLTCLLRGKIKLDFKNYLSLLFPTVFGEWQQVSGFYY